MNFWMIFKKDIKKENLYIIKLVNNYKKGPKFLIFENLKHFQNYVFCINEDLPESPNNNFILVNNYLEYLKIIFRKKISIVAIYDIKNCFIEII